MPAVEVRCPSCEKSYSIDSQLLGNVGRCRGCGTRFPLAPSGEASGSSEGSWKNPAPQTAPIPSRIGRFEIHSRLGSGAFGAVYRAHDPDLERDVALKVPHAGLMDDPKSVERFLREARSAARLRHPNIVPVHETGIAGKNYYIASAFIEGHTLSEILAAGPIDPSRAAEIAAELADALHAAHKLGTVHRDVKPLNVMIEEATGRPLLMDFGLARREDAGEKLTQDGAILGTPAYMAPEQATGKSSSADASCDQYALGVTLYEMLCGQTPFSGPLAIVLFHAIHTEPDPPSKRRPEIPQALEAICLRAMAKSPSDRFPDCQALASALRLWLGDPSGLSSPNTASSVPIKIEKPEPPSEIIPSAIISESSQIRLSSSASRKKRRPVPFPVIVASLATFAMIGTVLISRYRDLVGVFQPNVIAPNSENPDKTQTNKEREGNPDPNGVVRPAEPTKTKISDKSPSSRLPGALSGTPPSTVFRAIDPNRSLPADELVSIGLQVPLKPQKPVADGVIREDEYGPSLDVSFARNANPGRTLSEKIKGDDDLSLRLFTAYTETHLCVAVRVCDDTLDDDEANANEPFRNDSVHLYIDGDNTPNDFACGPTGFVKGSKEGFELVVDAAGHRVTLSNTFGSESWTCATSRTNNGYVVEIAIPLDLIDTKDGPGEVPAGPSSTFNFCLSVTDNDDNLTSWESLGILWYGDGKLPPWGAGEVAWVSRMHLGPAGFQSDFRNQPMVLDGIISPTEYGPPSAVMELKFNERPARWMRSAPIGPDDLSYEVYSSYTEKDLWFAVKVRDDVNVSGPRDKLQDSISVFIDGDRRANDYTVFAGQNRAIASAEGFDMRLTRSGLKEEGGGYGRWEGVVSEIPNGYIAEFQVPLSSIDMGDGSSKKIPAEGSTLRFNLAVRDVDDDSGTAWTTAPLWRDFRTDDPEQSLPGPAGEKIWEVELHLAKRVKFSNPDRGPFVIDEDSGRMTLVRTLGGSPMPVEIIVRDRAHYEITSSRAFVVTPDGTVIGSPGDPFLSAKPNQALPSMIVPR